MKNIFETINDPDYLEEEYRKNPSEFKTQFEDAFIKNPASEILKVWNARLAYEMKSIRNRSHIDVWYVVLSSLISGLLIKLPEFINISSEWYFARYTALIVMLPIFGYFLRKGNDNKIKLASSIFVIVSLIYITLLPEISGSSSIEMAVIHLPLFLLSIVGLAFCSNRWKDGQKRIEYIKYIGEVFIYSILILLGGVVLTFITLGLFELIKLSISEWYLSYVVVFGLMALT